MTLTKDQQARIFEHMDDLLQFWWQEYMSFKKLGQCPEDRESAAGALRQYRRVRADYRILGAA